MKPRTTSIHRLGLIMVALAVLLVYMVGAGRVYATFPGTNGRISFTRFIPATNGNEIFSI
jgi:hypothetical protein